MRFSDVTTTRWRWNRCRGRLGKQTHKKSAPKSPSAAAVLPHTGTSPTEAHNEASLRCTLSITQWTYCSKKPKTGKSLQLGDLRMKRRTRERRNALLKSPTFATTMPSALSDSDQDSETTNCRGRLAPFPPQGDVEETDSSDNEPAHADLGEGTMSRSVPVEDASQDLAFPHLGGQAPVTPEWPEGKERPRPLPRRRTWQRSPLSRRRPQHGPSQQMASDPRVYGGRSKATWKVASKLRYREERNQKRRRAKASQAAVPSSDRWGRR